jgi:hypothetical protein
VHALVHGSGNRRRGEPSRRRPSVAALIAALQALDELLAANDCRPSCSRPNLVEQPGTAVFDPAMIRACSHRARAEATSVVVVSSAHDRSRARARDT